MKKLPTDLEILNMIYKMYFDKYISFKQESPNRLKKAFVPIDIPLVAKNLQTETDIVFNRLYYHFEKKFSYKKDDNLYVNFFLRSIGGGEQQETNCINFPYMTSVLSALRHEERKYWRTTSIAITSLLISISSFLISVLSKSH